MCLICLFVCQFPLGLQLFSSLYVTLDYELLVVNEKDVEVNVKLSPKELEISVFLRLLHSLSLRKGTRRLTPLLHFPGEPIT